MLKAAWWRIPIYLGLSFWLTFAHAISPEAFKDAVTGQFAGTALARDFDEIIKSAIVTTIGDGSRKVIVFVDPYCQYCAKLEKNFSYVGNVTVYTVMFPLDPTQAKARNAIDYIWCASDADATMRSWFGQKTKRVVREVQGCHAPIDLMNAVAASLKITATPAIVFSHGGIKLGALSPYNLEDSRGN